MSSLPAQLDPWKAADQKRCVRGSIALRHLPRVFAVVAEAEGEVEFAFEFFRGDQRRPCLKGRIKNALSLECQRCLEHITQIVDSEFLLCIVQGFDEAEQLPEQYDPLLLEQDRIGLLDIIEDEILLALPPVPRHAQCEMAASAQVIAQAPDSAAAKANPFQVLAQLKKPIH